MKNQEVTHNSLWCVNFTSCKLSLTGINRFVIKFHGFKFLKFLVKNWFQTNKVTIWATNNTYLENSTYWIVCYSKMYITMMCIIANTYYCKYALLWPRQPTVTHSQLSSWELSLRLFPIWKDSYIIRSKPFLNWLQSLVLKSFVAKICITMYPK